MGWDVLRLSSDCNTVKSGRIRPKVHVQHKKTSSDRDLEQPHFLCLEEKPVAVGLREATVDFG